MKTKNYLFSIAVFISLIFMLLPVALAVELDSYDNSVLKTKEDRINLYQEPGDGEGEEADEPNDESFDDPGEACLEQHKKTSGFVEALDNGIISTLTDIVVLLTAIVQIASAIDTVLDAIAMVMGFDKTFCCTLPAPPSPPICKSITQVWSGWSAFYGIIEQIGCFVNCGWCTGANCFAGPLSGGGNAAAAGSSGTGAATTTQPSRNVQPPPPGSGAFAAGWIPNLEIFGPGQGIAQFGLNPYDNIYTAIGCLCPTAILFNLKKLKAIYQVYDCCIQQACSNGLSTAPCERQFDEATCMFWEGSIYSMLAKALMRLLVTAVTAILMRIFDKAAVGKFMACVFAVFKLLQIPGVITSIIDNFNMAMTSFDDPNCEDLGFKELKERTQEELEQAAEEGFEDVEEDITRGNPLAMVDRNGDGRYDSYANNYQTIGFSELPTAVQNSVRTNLPQGTNPNSQSYRMYRWVNPDHQEIYYYEAPSGEGGTTMYSANGQAATSGQAYHVRMNSLPPSITGMYGDNTAIINGQAVRFTRQGTSLVQVDAAGNVVSGGARIDFSNAEQRATYLSSYNLNTQGLTNAGTPREDTVNGQSGIIIPYDNGQVFISDSRPPTSTSPGYTQVTVTINPTAVGGASAVTTITNFGDGSRLTQTPPSTPGATGAAGQQGWEFTVGGNIYSGSGQIVPSTSTTPEQIATSMDNFRRAVTTANLAGQITSDTTQSWGDNGLTVTRGSVANSNLHTYIVNTNTGTVGQVRTTESWSEPLSSGGRESRTITTTTNTQTSASSVTLMRGTTTIATNVDPSVIRDRQIIWEQSYQDYIVFEGGLGYDDVAVRGSDGYTIYDQFERNTQTGVITVTPNNAIRRIQVTTVGNVVTRTESDLSNNQVTGRTVTTTQTIDNQRVEIVQRYDAQNTLTGDVTVNIVGRTPISINRNLFEANQPFNGLQGQNLVRAAEAYSDFGRPNTFASYTQGGVIYYSNGAQDQYGSQGYRQISYNTVGDQTFRYEKTFGANGNYYGQSINTQIGVASSIQYGWRDTTTPTPTEHPLTFAPSSDGTRYNLVQGTQDANFFNTRNIQVGGSQYQVTADGTGIYVQTSDGANRYNLADSNMPQDVRNAINQDPQLQRLATDPAARTEFTDRVGERLNEDQRAREEQAERERTQAERKIPKISMWEDSVYIATYDVVWQMLNFILGDYINDLILEQCKKDAEDSYPQHNEPVDSTVGAGIGNPIPPNIDGNGSQIPETASLSCQNLVTNTYNAQINPPTQLGNNSWSYPVSYSISAMCNSTFAYRITLKNPGGDEEYIADGSLGYGESVSMNYDALSQDGTFNRICIEADVTRCFPPETT